MSAVDPWSPLRTLTPARIGLRRAGRAPTTRAVLELQLAHARARDAVHAPLDATALRAALAPLETIEVASAAADRAVYLRRPDLGRRLSEESRTALPRLGCDVAFVIADGLSAEAAARHAAPVLAAAAGRLAGLSIGPVVIAHQARVAIGDDIGELVGARLVVVLIGERPGLSVADSLGAYVTYAPRVGRRDSERNCLSNIHGNGGIGHAEAGRALARLVAAALDRRLTGVGLTAALGRTEPTSQNVFN